MLSQKKKNVDQETI